MAIRGALGVVKRPLAVWALSGLELGSVCPSVQKCAVAVRAPLPRPSVRYAVASLVYSGPLYLVGFQTANEMGHRAAAKLFKFQDFF